MVTQKLVNLDESFFFVYLYLIDMDYRFDLQHGGYVFYACLSLWVSMNLGRRVGNGSRKNSLYFDVYLDKRTDAGIEICIYFII